MIKLLETLPSGGISAADKQSGDFPGNSQQALFFFTFKGINYKRKMKSKIL